MELILTFVFFIITYGFALYIAKKKRNNNENYRLG